MRRPFPLWGWPMRPLWDSSEPTAFVQEGEMFPSLKATDYAVHSYSQCGEDAVVLRGIFGEMRDGFYVDVGAHHPFRFSNTAMFYERGWTGINIDIDERAISAFEQCRPNDINVLCGVALQEGYMNRHLFNEGAVNTLVDKVAEEYKLMPGREIIEQKPVSVRRLSSILDEYMPKGRRLDLLDVDVEGLDEEVIRSNDWSRYRPTVILVETHGVTFESLLRHPISRFLSEQDYKPVGLTALTTIFRLV